jgi:hypothetical protein
MPVKSSSKIGAIHHYVPQGYLKRFSTHENDHQVYAYEINRDPYRVNVQNIAGQRDFYTFDDIDTGERDAAIEDTLADVDTAGIDMMRKLDTAGLGLLELGEVDKGNLLTYIAFQHTRNLQERKNHADMHDLMMSKILELSALDKTSWHEISKQNPNVTYDYDVVEKTRQKILRGSAKIKSDPNDQYFLSTALKMSEPLYRILYTQKRAVLVEALPNTSGFVTSDNPVTHYLLEDQKKALSFPFNGLGYVNAVFQFPISTTRCLLFMNDDMKIETFEYDQEAVDYINYYTYYYDDKWIFATKASRKFKK